MIGTTVSHYKIIEELGRGGMGVVYRAEDLKLKRTVALKFLPPHAVADKTEKERFAREAQAAAALNHPNIATVFEIDDSDEHPFIAMEFVEGKSLKDLLAAGQIKVQRAMDLAIQVAEGLHAAHEKGVVHRDMKSANVMVTDRDRVKIMDFGLAKLKGASLLTKQGTTLGTVAYMSPEQARGESVDHRSDIWSFGVVLYEMLTGRHPFPGEFEQAVVYNILNNEPEPISALRSGMPMELERIVNKCLAKEPGDRYQNIQEVPVDLRAVKAGMKSSGSDLSRVVSASRVMSGQSGMAGQSGMTGQSSVSRAGSGTGAPVVHTRSGRLAWITAAVMASIAIAAIYLLMKRDAVDTRPVHLQISIPAGKPLQLTNQGGLAVSRDGSMVVYRTITGLYLRRMDGNEAAPIAGTERAAHPFFSPDGRWIGFFADGKMKKVAVNGGMPINVADFPDARGAAWGDDGRIVSSNGVAGGLLALPEGGGEAVTLTVPDSTKNERTHRWPFVLPGGKTVIFTVGYLESPDYYEDATIDAINTNTGERKTLVRGASSAQYLSSGHLLYSRSGVLYAMPFDPDRMEISGTPVPVVEGVTGDPTTGAMNFAVSDDGVLAYIPGMIEVADRRLVKFDMQGNATPLALPVQSYIEPKVSPDGTRIAMAIGTGKDFDIWVYDIARTTLSRFTFGGVNRSPAWSPDGARIAYFSYGGATNSILVKRSDGGGSPDTLLRAPLRMYLNSWTRDGKYLVVDRQTTGQASDVCILPLAGKREFIHLVSSRFDEYQSAVSPDGRWLAHISNETGVYQVYVRKFPDGEGKWQISSDEAGEPRWSPDGRKLYYYSGGRLMSVDVDPGTAFKTGSPKVVFSGLRLLPVDSGQSYDITPDGKYIVTTQSSGEEESLTTIQVVLNLFTELKEKSGGGR